MGNGCLSDPCSQLTLTAYTEQYHKMECIDTLLREEGLNYKDFICFWSVLLTVRKSSYRREKKVGGRGRGPDLSAVLRSQWSLIPSLGNYVRL